MLRKRVNAHKHLSLRRVVWFGSIWVTVLALVLAWMLLGEQPRSWPRIGLNLIAAAVGMTAMLLAWRQHWRAAAHVCIWGAWGVAAAILITTGVVHSSSVLAFPALLVMSGWVLGLGASLAMLALSILLVAGLWWADPQGALLLRVHAPVAQASLFFVVYFAGMLGLVALVTLMARRSFGRRVTQLQQALTSLEQHQDQLRKFYRAVEQSPESIVITDTAACIVYVNQAFIERTGFSREEVLGQPTRNYSTMGMQAGQRRRARQQLARGALWRGQMTNRTKQGEDLLELVMVTPVRQPDGRIVNHVEVKQDLSERVRAERRIHELAHFDQLTGLPNRFSLMQRLLELARRGSMDADLCHGLLLLDMDRFTAFNDVRGTMRGDALLRALALRVATILPPDDLLARVAADEFAVLLEGIGRDPAEVEQVMRAFARTVQAALERPLWLEDTGEEMLVTCCLGGAFFSAADGEGAGSDVLRRASVALHEARLGGLSQIALFTPDMAEAASTRFRMEKELRKGIAEGQLSLYLQSQCNTRGICVGAEALVRWQHPSLGLVSPAQFIGVAEESDLIVLLGDWVLQQACSVLASEPFVERGLRLSVNVSSRQFRHGDFVDKLTAVLAATGAQPDKLTLEVTEGLVIRDFEQARRRMHALRRLGMEIALDDFGTGYSSLVYLQRLPIQELKIDKSFVQDSHISPNNASLVEAIVLVAQRFALRVVAEGVETAEQAALLAALSQDMVLQGYHFGRPEPAAQWLKGLAAEPKRP